MSIIAVIGGGLAAIAAARTIKHAGLEPLLIVRRQTLGEGLDTLSGPGWIADPHVPYARLGNGPLKPLIAEVGLSTSIFTLQDAVAERAAEGPEAIVQRRFADNRITLKEGTESLARAWSRQLHHVGGLGVGALRWRPSTRDFILRDQRSGAILRHPVSGKPIKVAGVVVALEGVEARSIIAGSACCEPLLPYYQKVRYDCEMAVVLITDRFDPGWCVLETPGDSAFRWIALEDRKGPGRAPANRSIVVARLTRARAAAYREADPAARTNQLIADLRQRFPEMPESAHESHNIEIMVPGDDSRLVIPPEGVPTVPAGIPLAFAGNYLGTGSLDSTAGTGVAAATSVLRRLGTT